MKYVSYAYVHMKYVRYAYTYHRPWDGRGCRQRDCAVAHAFSKVSDLVNLLSEAAKELTFRKCVECLEQMRTCSSGTASLSCSSGTASLSWVAALGRAWVQWPLPPSPLSSLILECQQKGCPTTVARGWRAAADVCVAAATGLRPPLVAGRCG